MKRTIFLAAFLLSTAVDLRADEPQFNRDVRPILAEHCFSCHGFDANSRKAKLRLDTPEGAYADRRGMIAIKPGDLKNSEAWQRIISDDSGEVMPPPSTKKSLTAEQKATLKAWIESGAKYQGHWAFEKVKRPPVPGQPERAKNPIDRFLNAQIEANGLQAHGEADRSTLIRRVSFALTGLPPTPEEVDQYLADAKPGAYERMVDRYLASPRFGEEMARHWLDIARYADTHGLHLDNERTIWPYRDWVVKAFNQNLPFDEFTRWQMAGDMLPNPSNDQLVATGFHRCNVSTSEGGSINEEWVYRYAVDRTSTLTEAWLGLSGGCAQCHDHKYDPISQKEFYSLYAFFYSAADPGMDGNINRTSPYHKLMEPEQQQAIQAAEREAGEALKKLRELAAKLDYQDPALAEDEQKPVPVEIVLFDDDFMAGSTNRNTSRNPAQWLTDPAFGTKSGRRVLKLKGGNFFDSSMQPGFVPVKVPQNGKFQIWVRPDPDQTPEAIGVTINGRRLVWGNTEGESPYGRVAGGKNQGELPKPGDWALIELPAEEFNLKPGQNVTNLQLQLVGGVAYWDRAVLKGEADPKTDPLASLKVWWEAEKGKIPAGLEAKWHEAFKAGPDKDHPAEAVAAIRQFYVSRVARPINAELAEARQVWEQAQISKLCIEDGIPGTMIFKDLPKPRQAFVMKRGQYDQPGDQVEPNVPEVLPPLKLADPNSRPTRMDLAEWLIDRDNPLVSRVTANRLWQQFFGTGIVKTSADFGTQGDLPSHPELLDWLAAEFIDPTYQQAGYAIEGSPTRWDVKRFVRLLVTSDAFKRESRFTPELLSKDPENRLYARGPRFRLDAEQIRDNALYVSGLINLKMGGPGVNPYQPPNIWEPVGYGDSNTRYFLQDTGANLYRRSLYTFLKRTAPPPFMSNFDAPNREQLCSARDRTNTPLQALQLMNDVQHVEAARALAERALTQGGQSDADKIAYLYRLVLARLPADQESELVSRLLTRQRQLYQADPEAAKRLARTGDSKPKLTDNFPEVAAWTMVSNLLFNLDETLNRN